MSNITRQLNAWQSNTTVVRSSLVAPTFAYVMGEVCPQGVTAIAGSAAVTPMAKRHLDAAQATTGSFVPWSPPVT